MAAFGIGSWQDVIAIQEEALRKQEAQNDVPGQISTLISLIGMAINGGDKQKAKQYVTEAERVLAQAKPEDIDLPLLVPQPFRPKLRCSYPELADFVPRHISATPMAAGFNAASPEAQQAVIQEVSGQLAGYKRDAGVRIPFRTHLAMATKPKRHPGGSGAAGTG